MEQFFASLSKRQTMLLLTAVTFGGNEAPGAFEHLPDVDAELLKHRAQALLQIPREKRIPLLVQEIKRLVTSRRGSLWAADPDLLADLLRKERPSMVEVVLRGLPANLADAMRERLPDHRAELVREIRPPVLHILRWKLEELLSKAASGKAVFKFSDVVALQGRELFTVCDRMGARALATAMAGLPDAEREALFQKLPPDQRSLAQRASAAGESRKLSEEDARKLLELHGALENPSTGLRSAGAQRLARACLAQSPELAARVAEKHRGELGQLFVRWVKEERQRPPSKGDGGRADIVEQLERLAQKGIIDRPVRAITSPRKAPPKSAPAARPPSLAAPPRPERREAAFGPLPTGRLPPPSRMPGLSASAVRQRLAEREPLDPAASGRPADPLVERELRGEGGSASGHRRAPLGDRELRGGSVSGPIERELRGGSTSGGGSGHRRDPIAERDPRAQGASSSGQRRDPIAERELRRASPPAAPAEAPRRDPIAEREARKAGLPVGRPAAPAPDPGEGRGGSHVARPPRAPRSTPPPRPPRGSKGGSR